jgi:hypothetical protein
MENEAGNEKEDHLPENRMWSYVILKMLAFFL